MDARTPTTAEMEHAEAVALADVYTSAPPEVALELGIGHAWRGRALAAWAPGVDVLAFNRALGIGVDEPATAADVEAIARLFDEAGSSRSFLQLVPEARPSGLADWLGASGYTRYNRWARLVRALADGPAPPHDIRVERIGRERAPLFGEIVASAFRMPPLSAWLAAPVGRPGWAHYLAYDGDDAIGAAAFRAGGRLATFGQAGTREAARGRGAQSALIARRLADAAAMGCTHATVETAEDLPEKPAPSFRNLRRLGFELVYFRVNYLRTRPTPGC